MRMVVNTSCYLLPLLVVGFKEKGIVLWGLVQVIRAGKNNRANPCNQLNFTDGRMTRVTIEEEALQIQQVGMVKERSTCQQDYLP